MPKLQNPRLKGHRLEKRFVDKVISLAGLPARRKGNSWDRGTDAVVPFCGHEIPAQVKARRNEFANLYEYLGANEVLVVQDDFQEQLIVCRTSDWCRHLRLALERREAQPFGVLQRPANGAL